MREEEFYISGKIYADTLGEILRALGEYYIVSVENGSGISLTRKE